MGGCHIGEYVPSGVERVRVWRLPRGVKWSKGQGEGLERGIAKRGRKGEW
jgi:hypothetical protein